MKVCAPRQVLLLFLLAASLGASGCGDDGGPVGGVPEGWEAEGDRWWRAAADTAGAFRDLSGLEAMGVGSDVLFASSRATAQDRALQQGQMKNAVKRSLIALYRVEPEVVDSLFERFAAPLVQSGDMTGDPGDVVERYKKRSYDVLRRHFREPSTIRSLGTDIAVPYPDSLQRRRIGGAVRMQVRLDAEGEPVAVQLVEPVHPVLDEIAMRATTEMRWQPAYLRVRNNWSAIPAWSRFSIHFAVRGEGG